MKEEVDAVLAKLKDDTATKKDVMELSSLADRGNTKAALNYGICLFVGHLIDEDREEASRYFEKVYISGRIEELNELADFYNEVGGPAYSDLSDMIVKKAMSKFKELSLDEQLDFFMEHANTEIRRSLLGGRDCGDGIFNQRLLLFITLCRGLGYAATL